MTDPKQDRLFRNSADRSGVVLSKRDLEDARRLIGILSEADVAEQGSDVSCALYERLRNDSATLQRRAEQILALRERRAKAFGRAMFGEPAWDILLVLYTAGGGITMNHLARMSGVSQATGIRWMNYLADQKLVERQADPNDARSLRLTLTDKGRTSLDAFLSAAEELSGH